MNLYDKVTKQIIEQLEAGAKPWQKSWKGSQSFSMPRNAITGKDYNGINIPLLWTAQADKGLQTSEFATFKQWKEKGRMVAKGEKGTMIVFFKMLDVVRDDKEEKIPMLRQSTVFSECQLQDYQAKPPVDAVDLTTRIAQADNVVKQSGASVKHGGNQAFYQPSTDSIQMPDRESFIATDESSATENYYSTLLHELTHWTGHKQRLDRLRNTKRFGDNAYAFEELVAELGSAFLCAKLGVSNAPRADHASYLASWLKVLKQDSRAIFTASSQASKACAFIMGDAKPIEAKPIEDKLSMIVAASAIKAKLQSAFNF